MPGLIRPYAAESHPGGVCLVSRLSSERSAQSWKPHQVYHGVETPITVTMPDEPLFYEYPEQFQVLTATIPGLFAAIACRKAFRRQQWTAKA